MARRQAYLLLSEKEQRKVVADTMTHRELHSLGRRLKEIGVRLGVVDCAHESHAHSLPLCYTHKVTDGPRAALFLPDRSRLHEPKAWMNDPGCNLC